MLLLGISIVWPSKEITIQFTAFLTADPQSHALPFHYLLQLSYSVIYHVYLNLSSPQYKIFLILLSGQKENRPRVECRPAWTLLAPLRVSSPRPHQEKSPQPPLPHMSKPSCLWKQPSVSRCTSQSQSCCWLTPIPTLTEPWQGRGFPSSQHLIGRIVRQKHLRWRCHLHPLLVREEEHWMQSGKVD